VVLGGHERTGGSLDPSRPPSSIPHSCSFRISHFTLPFMLSLFSFLALALHYM